MSILEYVQSLEPNFKHRLELGVADEMFSDNSNPATASEDLKKWLGFKNATLNIRTIERRIHMGDISRFKDVEAFKDALRRDQTVADYLEVELVIPQIIS